MDLPSIGAEIAKERRVAGLSQTELALQAGISRATLDALENGRAGEVGYKKINKLLAALGFELTMRRMRAERPTLDELMQEDRDDQGLDGRR
jgi:transcriptional regulator with XRE-family HTH domain